MNKNQLVSVIIPTYNYAHYISEAIDSILNSNFPQEEIEIIIIDDGSKDNTSEKITAYGNRIKYIFQENSGKAWATKIGIDNCHGKYVFNLDADDLFLPNKIQEVVQIFESDPDIVHVAHPAFLWQVEKNIKAPESISKNIIGRKIYGKELLKYFYRSKILFGGGSTFAARTDIIKKFTIPKEVDIYIDEYLVMWTLNQGYSYFLDSPLSVWRIHDKNFSDIYSNRDLYEEKMQRSFNSMKAIFQHMNDFEQEMLNLYSLKLEIFNITLKEDLGRKKIADIFNMWLFFVKYFKLFSRDSMKIIKSYTLLNRSLPTSMLKFLRKFKSIINNLAH